MESPNITVRAIAAGATASKREASEAVETRMVEWIVWLRAVSGVVCMCPWE